MTITKREYTAVDAAPIVLYVKRDRDSLESYPLMVDSDGVLMVKDIPSDLKMRVAYDSYNREEYIGHANMGTATNEASWLIQKLTYDGVTRRVTERNIASNVAWDTRESESYS